MSAPATIVIGSPTDEVERIRHALGAVLEPVPWLDAPVPGSAPGLDWGWAAPLDRWRAEAGAGDRVGRVVVAPWIGAEAVEPEPLATTALGDWMTRSEVPLARWWAAMGVAALRCVDGGAVVAVVERPPPLDAAGWAPAAAVAEAAENMARSLARSEGGRGVRVNAVTTPVRLHRPPVVDPAPPLAGFPGTVDDEVVGAVRMLLSADAVGVTGTAVHADCGRSWR